MTETIYQGLLAVIAVLLIAVAAIVDTYTWGDDDDEDTAL